MVGAEHGDVTTARLRLEESLAIFRQIGDKGGIAYALMTLGEGTSHAGGCRRRDEILEESSVAFPRT